MIALCHSATFLSVTTHAFSGKNLEEAFLSLMQTIDFVKLLLNLMIVISFQAKWMPLVVREAMNVL